MKILGWQPHIQFAGLLPAYRGVDLRQTAVAPKEGYEASQARLRTSVFL